MKVVIIGGVAAGMSAASKMKRLLKDQAEIVVYEKGEEVSYGACGIPILLVKGREMPHPGAAAHYQLVIAVRKYLAAL